MRHPWAVLGMALALSFLAAGAHAQQAQPAPGAGPAATAGQDVPRDPFFWLGEINKASAVINTDDGLLDKSMAPRLARSEEHTSELQSLMRLSYAVICLKKKKQNNR